MSPPRNVNSGPVFGTISSRNYLFAKRNHPCAGACITGCVRNARREKHFACAGEQRGNLGNLNNDPSRRHPESLPYRFYSESGSREKSYLCLKYSTWRRRFSAAAFVL